MAIKETKEALVGLLALTEIIGKELKDGIQLQDLVNILNAYNNNPVKKAEIDAALKDAGQIAGEIKAIDLAGGVELAVLLVARLPGLISALTAKSA